MIKNCCMISTWKMSLLGMKRAAPLLKRNVPVHEAILMAVKTVEDDPLFHRLAMVDFLT